MNHPFLRRSRERYNDSVSHGRIGWRPVCVSRRDMIAMSRGMSDPITPRNTSDEMTSWTRDWGQLLRGARQVAGLSLAGLSDRTGLSRGYLSKLESGQDGARNPSRATLVALAHALPSFRPLAYQLEPVESTPTGITLVHEEVAPLPPRILIGLQDNNQDDAQEDDGELEEPIQLGWRELEALVALLALERAAIPTPITARLIARATDRPLESVIPTLERLTRTDALVARPPIRPGGDPSYTRGSAFESRLGLSRLGDALVLAAALLSQAAPLRPISSHKAQ